MAQSLAGTGNIAAVPGIQPRARWIGTQQHVQHRCLRARRSLTALQPENQFVGSDATTRQQCTRRAVADNRVRVLDGKETKPLEFRRRQPPVAAGGRAPYVQILVPAASRQNLRELWHSVIRPCSKDRKCRGTHTWFNMLGETQQIRFVPQYWLAGELFESSNQRPLGIGPQQGRQLFIGTRPQAYQLGL